MKITIVELVVTIFVSILLSAITVEAVMYSNPWHALWIVPASVIILAFIGYIMNALNCERIKKIRVKDYNEIREQFLIRTTNGLPNILVNCHAPIEECNDIYCHNCKHSKPHAYNKDCELIGRKPVNVD